ncbi:hypothetical protein SKAU_G00285760 [Synaphobranchus kaupii]|uniref:PiggyBac transposable element-derived protein domain-containing protein n=1 Tax=Synaphobranchus kaupii TaxID=118154 RepID=A0A9Q1EY31_SYNKA|nr:hypothetical protein SKAU_G00285760 [Synaphobranchus kaupii]
MRTPGAQLDLQQDNSPLELFQLFCSKDAIRILCQNTNINAQRKHTQGFQTPWTDVDAEELFRYLSIVIYLGLVPFLGSGYHVYVDNFYTSSALFHHLHQIHYGACGTIRQDRISFPKTQVNALPKTAARGDMRWFRDGPLLYVKWKDTRDVIVCSTIHKAYSGGSVQRRVKSSDDPVLDYNKYMGGIDMS